MGGSSSPSRSFPHPILRGSTIRIDPAGDGRFGSSRGGRRHEGIDLVIGPGEQVFAPFDGTFVRNTSVYGNPSNDCQRLLTGIVIRGNGAWSDFEVKVFYLRGIVTGSFTAGTRIGFAQNVAVCYEGSGMRNHIHVEVRQNGIIVDPSNYLEWY